MSWSKQPGRQRLIYGALLIVLVLSAALIVGLFLDNNVQTAQNPRTGNGVAGIPEEQPSKGFEGRRPAATPFAAILTPEQAAAGVSAPDFTLPDLYAEDKTYSLSAYRGRPLILNFWASWCVPCRREMPALQAMAAQFRAEGLMLLGMNQTYLDNLDAARAFVKDLELTFPNTRDDSGTVGKYAYQVVGIPTTVFIDRDGAVAHIQIGEMSGQQISDFAERLVAGEPLRP